METVQVRRFDPSEVAAYRTIRLAALRTAPEAFTASHEIEAAWPAETFAHRLTTSRVLGAWMGGEPVGVLAMRWEERPRRQHSGHVWGMFVQPAARGRGVAEALMAAVLQAARGEVEQVTLGVLADNTAAIALYRKFGFETYGVEPRAVKGPAGYQDELSMVCFLEARR